MLDDCIVMMMMIIIIIIVVVGACIDGYPSTRPLRCVLLCVARAPHVMVAHHCVCKPQAWEGAGVVKSARKLIGATNPLEAEPGTIRGDLAIQTGRNIVHGSDSVENGEREVALWFGEGEVLTWAQTVQPWLTE